MESTVAVVDDDVSVRRALERLLRAAGFAVRAFASAKSFLEATQSDGFGCAILDVRMPGQSGLDLHDILTAAGFQIPVIFISGDMDSSIADRAMRVAATRFLSKPFSDHALLSAVTEAIATRTNR